MNNWYFYRSKDKKVKGYVMARDEEAVVKFARYPLSKLVIECVEWDGERFVKDERNT